jgi:hypothetical protein
VADGELAELGLPDGLGDADAGLEGAPGVVATATAALDLPLSPAGWAVSALLTKKLTPATTAQIATVRLAPSNGRRRR